MMAVRTHRDLIVWQKSMELVEEVHRLESRVPREAMRSLKDQLRRAVASVPANIAEGAGRVHRAEYRRFVSIARGSLMETSTLLEVAMRRGHLRNEDFSRVNALCDEVLRMLTTLGKRLERPAVDFR